MTRPPSLGLRFVCRSTSSVRAPSALSTLGLLCWLLKGSALPMLPAGDLSKLVLSVVFWAFDVAPIQEL
jgi:hypothetical protein